MHNDYSDLNELPCSLSVPVALIPTKFKPLAKGEYRPIPHTSHGLLDCARAFFLRHMGLAVGRDSSVGLAAGCLISTFVR